MDSVVQAESGRNTMFRAVGGPEHREEDVQIRVVDEVGNVLWVNGVEGKQGIADGGGESLPQDVPSPAPTFVAVEFAS